MTMGVTVVTLFSILTVGVAVSAGPVNQTSRCEAGHFAVGENAHVTCFFNTDIRQTMHEVYVTRYRFDSVENGTNALTCKRRTTKELECRAADGYLFNNIISDNLTLEIPNAIESFSGQYACELATHTGIHRNTCDLNIKETVLTCQAGIFTEGTTASVTCSFHKDMENTIHHVYVLRYPFNATENMTTPLICFRLHNKQLECKTKEGYSYSGIISHKLTLDIPEVKKRFAGRYSCQIVPPDDIPTNTCNFNVTAYPCKTCKEPKDEDAGPRDIALISVSILAVLFLCIAIFIWCKRDSIRKCLCGCFTPSQTKDHKATGNAGLKEVESLIPVTETESEIDFYGWVNGLPTDAREALQKNGFDNLRSFKLAKENAIKALQLKLGHELLVREKLNAINGQSLMPLQANTVFVGHAESTQPSPTVSIRKKRKDASDKGGERTLPERQVQDSAKKMLKRRDDEVSDHFDPGNQSPAKESVLDSVSTPTSSESSTPVQKKSRPRTQSTVTLKRSGSTKRARTKESPTNEEQMPKASRLDNELADTTPY